MIISRLQGGLGNQMFQYAAARSLSCRLKQDLKLDTQWFTNCKADTKRQYGLDQFTLKTKKATVDEVAKITRLYQKPFTYLPEGIQQYIRHKKLIIWHRKETPRDYLFESISNNQTIYLDGFWQCEAYFKEHESVIRDDLRFKSTTDTTVKSWIEKIDKTNAISLHIRRGDYVNNPKTNAFHGLLPITYYEKAIEQISSRAVKPTFFVFSDDISWAQDNLRCRYPMEFVTHQGDDCEDMRLMSLCNHHIVANSSFSWWGAWLNPSTDKIVIAPKKWFATTPVDTCDVVPQTWIKI